VQPTRRSSPEPLLLQSWYVKASYGMIGTYQVEKLELIVAACQNLT